MRLEQRECEVMDVYVSTMGDRRETSELLNISLATTKTYLHRVRKKFGIHKRSAPVQLYLAYKFYKLGVRKWTEDMVLSTANRF